MHCVDAVAAGAAPPAAAAAAVVAFAAPAVAAAVAQQLGSHADNEADEPSRFQGIAPRMPHKWQKTEAENRARQASPETEPITA